MNLMQILFAILIMCSGTLVMASSRNVAAVPRTVIAYQEHSNFSPELVVAYNRFKNESFESFSVIKFPSTGQSTAEKMLEGIADQTVLGLWNSPSFKQSAFGKTASDVEKSMTKQVAIGKKNEHKFNFQVLAFENVAKVEYEGLGKAVVYYQAKAAELGVQVSQKLTQRHDLILSHQIQPIATVSQVNLKWNW